jgi:hypothetical protein
MNTNQGETKENQLRAATQRVLSGRILYSYTFTSPDECDDVEIEIVATRRYTQ